VIQQLREAFPFDSAPGYLIFDRAANFSEEVVSTMEAFGIQPKRTGLQNPWQNGVADRWVGSCRRDLLDHVIVLNERHLKRLMSECVRYYNQGRPHSRLGPGIPDGERLLHPGRIATTLGKRSESLQRPFWVGFIMNMCSNEPPQSFRSDFLRTTGMMEVLTTRMLGYRVTAQV
jgi:transposase InsO family protein